MLILGPLGMYLDAAVVFVKTFLLLFRLVLAMLREATKFCVHGRFQQIKGRLAKHPKSYLTSLDTTPF